jgi:hypothetical protein
MAMLQILIRLLLELEQIELPPSKQSRVNEIFPIMEASDGL